MTPNQRTLRAVIALVLGVTAACADNGPAAPPAHRPAALTPAMLTGEALEALGPDGKFTRVVPPEAQPYEMMTGTQAADVMREFWRLYGNNMAQFLSRDVKESVSAELRVCSEPVLAEPSFEALPASEPVIFRAFFGPKWHVIMCEGETPRALAALGAFATTLVGRTAVEWDEGLLNASFTYAYIPRGRLVISTAEIAASEAFRRTGVKVSALPRKVLAEPPYGGNAAYWQIELADSIDVVGKTVGSRRVSRLIVGNDFSRGYYEDVIAVDMRAEAPDRVPVRSGSTMLLLGRRPGMAAISTIDPVTVVRRVTP